MGNNYDLYIESSSIGGSVLTLKTGPGGTLCRQNSNAEIAEWMDVHPTQCKPGMTIYNYPEQRTYTVMEFIEEHLE